jgi:hypothetical protein
MWQAHLGSTPAASTLQPCCRCDHPDLTMSTGFWYNPLCSERQYCRYHRNSLNVPVDKVSFRHVHRYTPRRSIDCEISIPQAWIFLGHTTESTLEPTPGRLYSLLAYISISDVWFPMWYIGSEMRLFGTSSLNPHCYLLHSPLRPTLDEKSVSSILSGNASDLEIMKTCPRTSSPSLVRAQVVDSGNFIRGGHDNKFFDSSAALESVICRISRYRGLWMHWRRHEECRGQLKTDTVDHVVLRKKGEQCERDDQEGRKISSTKTLSPKTKIGTFSKSI